MVTSGAAREAGGSPNFSAGSAGAAEDP